MATHDNPAGAVQSIGFTADTTVDILFAAAFALIALGMCGLAAVAGREAWPVGTGVVAALAPAASLALATGSDQTDLILFAAGILVFPIWLLWTVRFAAGRS